VPPGQGTLLTTPAEADPGAADMVLLAMQEPQYAEPVVAELMGATRGLGYMLVEGREFVRIDVIVGGIILFSIVGKLVDQFVRLLESRFLRWRDTFPGC